MVAMSNAELGVNSRYLLHLMSCALRGAQVVPLPEGASWDAVFSLAKANSVAATCAFSATGAASDAAVAAKWRAEADQNLFRIANFEIQRDEILEDMHKVGLSWVLLKGQVVGPLYPHAEMRWMCDNDILYGFVHPNGKGGFEACDIEDAALEMRCIMEQHGFETTHFGLGCHDMYQKLPFFNFEMHHGLASTSLSWWRYYEHPWSRARQTQQPSAFEFLHEDVYVFHIAHMFKHFDASGSGVRGIADEWVLLDAWGKTLNWEYIEQQLQQLGMVAFEADLRRVAIHVIGEDVCGQTLRASAANKSGMSAQQSSALTPEDAAMVAYMLGSGTYGNVRNRVENGIRKNKNAGKSSKFARMGYLLQRVFPPRESLQQGYAVLQKHPWALPAVYAYRLVVKPFTRTKYIAAEVRAIAKAFKKEEE